MDGERSAALFGWRLRGASVCLLASMPLPLAAAPGDVTIVGPANSEQFGQFLTVLTNGNVVISDPLYGPADVGAVYLYSPTGTLISALTGSSANDHVGSGGIKVLHNGNFVVVSPEWNSASATTAGAVTWGSAVSGVNGTVSAANSLVGSHNTDQVGSEGIVVLTNGNYVVVSKNWINAPAFATNAGAVTWGNGNSGTSGVVSAANSLVGTASDSNVGAGGVTTLNNGNYVVASPDWPNLEAFPVTFLHAGAVTWGSGSSGVSGAISSANSLVGTTTDDAIGNRVTALTNGNYAVASWQWHSAGVDIGAVTWGNGNSGTKGAVAAANSLVGSKSGDLYNPYIAPLTNGNFVVSSYDWHNGLLAYAGAATWRNGSAPSAGVISAAISLVGSSSNDSVGNVWALTNGNYVVTSSSWTNGTAQGAGAATWGNGSTGISGTISSGNSLIGVSPDDQVGYTVTALTNGNYVVSSPYWDINGAMPDVGAVTWGSGTTGVSGFISPSNSMVGSLGSDHVGEGDVTALANGNYAFGTPEFDSSSGAVTWGNGTIGSTGYVSGSNSLVGKHHTVNADFVGFGGILALTNGNYVVQSPDWDSDVATDVGAITWASGAGVTSGTVSVANSLVGTLTGDLVGNEPGFALDNGNYMIFASKWALNGATPQAGAITWGNGAVGTSGAISAANSLTSQSAYDVVGCCPHLHFADGSIVVVSQRWTNAGISLAGAVTLMPDDKPTTGFLGADNSLVGTVMEGFPDVDYNPQPHLLAVGWLASNTVTLRRAELIFRSGFEAP